MGFKLGIDEGSVAVYCDCEEPKIRSEVVFRRETKEVPRPKKRPKKVDVLKIEFRCRKCRNWEEGILKGLVGDVP